MHAPHGALQLLAHLSAALRAHAAPFRANASFEGAQCFGVSEAGRHADVLPDRLQIFLFDTQQVNALAACDLDPWNVVFVHRVRNPAQLTGVGFSALHPWNHTVAAVFLDVSVAASSHPK